MAQDTNKNAESQERQDTYTYGLGNPNVQYTAVPWDVFLSIVAMVVLPIGMLMVYYDLGLVGFTDWFASLFDIE